jgi:RNA polymerase sigma factor (sigma-70 family)
VAAVVRRHERTLLRVARQASLCHDDALDAYQRALEIFVRRVDTVDPATEVAWLKVVIRHEAMAIRRARSEAVADADLDLDSLVSVVERSVEEQIASTERVRRSAEALRALKPDEAKALMMKAHGLSYEEIGERNGWTYTKVNRAISEGRRRFMAAFEGIESGEECERFAQIVEALASGSATSAQLLAIRPHLRHCVACRAAVRDLHLTRLHRAYLLWPIFGSIWEHGQHRAAPDSLRELPPDGAGADQISGAVHETSTGAQSVADHLVGREVGQANEHINRLRSLRDDVYALVHRANASDVATGLNVAAGSGGGRVATIAATIGVCVTSATVGTACVVTSFLSTPTNRLHSTSAEHRSHGDRGQSRAANQPTASDAQSAPSGYGNTATATAQPHTAPRATPATNAKPVHQTHRKKTHSRTAAEDEFGFETASATEPRVATGTTGSSTTSTAQSASSAPNQNTGASGTPDPAQEEFGP